MRYNLEFVDITAGFHWSIHDRHTALYQTANNNEILLELKNKYNGHQIGLMLLEEGVESSPTFPRIFFNIPRNAKTKTFRGIL